MRRDNQRENNRPSRFNDRFSGPREMHKAVCAECNAECEVPFKPREGKPVYCRDCYRNKRPAF
ncbi:DNA-directed RNA polymerase [Candidatus Woesearchaeota archaeon]|nr:DNA-directed RNA polymerase [Candidatus Woesearchaeota archaeon]